MFPSLYLGHRGETVAKKPKTCINRGGVSFMRPSAALLRKGEPPPDPRTVDASSLPTPSKTLWPSYGAAHTRPILALARPVGAFEVDLTVFKVGMPVSCKYIDGGHQSHGWFPGIIHRIDGDNADIDYDDGDYGYAVAFKHLRLLGKPAKRKFEVEPLPAPRAIVLSIPHAYEAVAEAARLIRAIGEELGGKFEDTATFSTPPQSRCATPSEVTSADNVEFAMERFGTARGRAAGRPTVRSRVLSPPRLLSEF